MIAPPSPQNAQARMLDHVTRVAGLGNDAELSRFLEISSAAVSKMRHAKLPVGAAIIIRIHEATDLSIREIKERAGLVCLPSLQKLIYAQDPEFRAPAG